MQIFSLRFLIRFAGLASLLMFLQGCTLQEKISFEALTPAQLTLPSHSDRVCIFNHALRPTSDSNGVFYAFDRNLYYDSTNYDTLASNALIAGLLDGFEISGRLTSAGEPLILPRKSKQPATAIQPFETLSAVCLPAQAGFALVIENISLFDELAFQLITDNYWLLGIRVRIEADFRLYDIREQIVIDRLKIMDTLVEYKFGSDWEEVLSQFPPREEVFAETAYQAGKYYASRITPGLRTHERTYFHNGNAHLKEGHQFAAQGLWASAASRWIQAAGSKRNRLAALGAHNMAVASEMEGKPEIALFWIHQALERKSLKKSREMKAQLEERIPEIDLLQQQMNTNPNPAEK